MGLPFAGTVPQSLASPRVARARWWPRPRRWWACRMGAYAARYVVSPPRFYAECVHCGRPLLVADGGALASGAGREEA